MQNFLNDDLLKLFNLPSQSSSSLKTDLFIKSNQLRQMSQQLERIMLLPKKKKEAWVRENEGFLNKMMDDFAHDSDLVLEALDGDSQTVALSMEYVTNLRDVMNVVRSIYYDNRRLQS